MKIPLSTKQVLVIMKIK